MQLQIKFEEVDLLDNNSNMFILPETPEITESTKIIEFPDATAISDVSLLKCPKFQFLEV